MLNLPKGLTNFLDIASAITLYGSAILGVFMIIRYIVRFKQGRRVDGLNIQSTEHLKQESA